MRNALRLGVFRDRVVFEQLLPVESPLVIPAHIGAYALDGLRGFLAGISRTRDYEIVDFVFDPMTYWIDLPARYWSRGSERARGADLELPLPDGANEKELIRPTLLALLREYGLATALFETDLAGMRSRLLDAVDACLDFQRRGTHTRRGRARSKYARILELAEEEEAMQPMATVAPYLTLPGLDDADVTDQVALNERSLAGRLADEAMWTILALDARTQLAAITTDVRELLRLADFDVVGVWVSDLDEYVETSSRLRAYRAFLRSIGRPVWLLYGSYFGLLLGRDGVELVSHGIYYTESKRMHGPVGSGPPPERYYVPALHRFYEPTRAFRLLELVPTFECRCQECPSVEALRAEATAAASSPARRMAWAQRLQKHFLLARAAEVEAVNTRPLPELLNELQAASESLASIDEAERVALEIPVGHLGEWQRALLDE